MHGRPAQSFELRLSLDAGDRWKDAKEQALRRRGLPLNVGLPLRIEGYPQELLPRLAFCIASPKEDEVGPDGGDMNLRTC